MLDTDDTTEGGGRADGDRPFAVDSVPVSALDRELIRARVAAVYQSHGAELRRFILGVLRDPDLTADVLQVTFARALERGDEVREGSLKAWLFRVAFHEALAIRRRAKTGEAAMTRLAELGRAVDALPEALLIREEEAVAVRMALEDLPNAQRKVVIARLYDDKSFSEIASDAGVPIGTVLTRMRLALDKLRNILRANEH